MKDNFNLKSFLTENNLTTNTRKGLNEEQEDWQGKEWKNRKLLIEVVEGLQRELEEIEDVKLWDDQTSNDWCHDAIEQFSAAAQSIIGE
jgi:hypothetical protein